MTSLHEIKVVRFEAGSMTLHANTTSGYNHSNSTDNDNSTTTSRRILVGREIEGKLVLSLSMQSFVRGLWVKLVGCSMSTSEDLAGNVTIQSDDLFRGSSSCGADDVHYHLDGLHEVLLGYGEEVPTTTTTTTSTGESHVILQPGQHQFCFSFTLPSNAPASFFSDSSSITYRLVAVLDAYSEYERVTIEHDIIVLHYSHLRCLQLWDEVSSRSEVIRKNSSLSTAPGGTTTSNDRRMPSLLPSLLHLIRFASPQPKAVRLGMIVSKTSLGASTFNPYRSSGSSSSTSTSSLSSSSSTSSVEFLCSIDNLSLADGAYVVVRGEVYSEYTSRESPQHPFTAHYPGKNESIDDSSSTTSSSREGRCTCILSKISETRKAVYNSSELARFIFLVPLDIDLKPSIRGLCSEPDPVPISISQALHHGQIIHYRTECSSFRYRIMLRVTLLCLNNNGEGSSNQTQQLVAPLFGEIYIPPPNDTVQSCIHMLDAPPPFRSNPSESSLDPWNDANEEADDDDAVVVRAPSMIASRPLQPVAVSNRPPSGGRNRAHRNAHGLSGGIRATCRSSLSGNTATVRSTSRSGDENTFIHPNIYIPTPPPLSSTPHAKPTSARPVIRVDAEMVSRGPAAPLIDRLTDHPRVPAVSVTTPQRFAFMYEVVSAEVMEGTPVPNAATPVPLSTEEFHRVRRRTWHYTTRDASVNAVPAVDGLSDQGQDMVSHRTNLNSIDGGQLHMNSRLFDGTYDRIT